MSTTTSQPSSNTALKSYGVVTANYWAFTLTDGALRMLVVLHFHSLGYSALNIAFLFLFYELFGVITNLVGGWLGARIGLNNTMNIGLGLQVLALAMLCVPSSWLTVVWVMLAQALSGVAKDLNKMSAKSAIKQLVGQGNDSALYRWVSLLTGSKNALKGVGFFIGAFLLSSLGFTGALALMASLLAVVWAFSLWLLRHKLGKTQYTPKFRHLLAKSRAINVLSAARLCLFAARDIWFVVAVPVFFSQQLGWSPMAVGSFFALWVIAYGGVQTLAPKLNGGQLPQGKQAALWALGLAFIPLAISLGLHWPLNPTWVLVAGLSVFGVVFAVNSAMHSFLIVQHASFSGTSLDVGFYYMANAAGRLLGTVLSGVVYQYWGLAPCLWVASGLLLLSAASLIGLKAPAHQA